MIIIQMTGCSEITDNGEQMCASLVKNISLLADSASDSGQSDIVVCCCKGCMLKVFCFNLNVFVQMSEECW